MIGYWCVVVLMLASVMASCGYEFRQGVFLSTTMLPGMFCAKLSLPGALRASNRRAVAVAGVAGGILVIEWLALLLAHRYIWSGWLPGDGMVFHVLFYNPVFIGLLLAAVLIPERLLDRWIKARLPRMETVSFISERRKVTNCSMSNPTTRKCFCTRRTAGSILREPGFRSGSVCWTIGSYASTVLGWSMPSGCPGSL